MPETECQKFVYADDMTFAIYCKDIENGEAALERDLTKISTHLRKWRLKPNPIKTEVSIFHLNNHLAQRELQVKFEGFDLRHNFNPKVLGVTLDRSLTYHAHLDGKSKKLATRNNLLQMIAGTTWGAKADTLRSAALSLVFAPSEYCCSSWINSVHCSKINVQLNRSMRLITGTMKSTPLQWLPVLSNIAPVQLRREQALVNTIFKCKTLKNSLLFEFLQDPPDQSLVRKPPYLLAKELMITPYNIKERWKDSWDNSSIQNDFLIDDPCLKLPGFNLPRKTWCQLNRLRTGYGKSASTLFKWGAIDHPSCDCGVQNQTINHISQECPIRRFEGTLEDINQCTDEAISWINNLDLKI